jgi:hypothetical protein
VSFLDSKNAAVSIAVLIAVILIIGAYVLSGHHFGSALTVNAESSADLLKAYAAKDSDSDGLPDWEEALYGTDPNNPHSIRPDMADGEAVAKGLATPHSSAQPATATSSVNLAANIPGKTAPSGSLTDQFSVLFFNNYMQTRGATPPSAADQQTFIVNAVGELEKTRIVPDAYASSNIRVSGTGQAAFKSYAVAVDDAFTATNPKLPFDELTYFSDATNKGDATAIANLKKISDSYIARAKAVAAIPVPQEAATASLALANTMAKLGGAMGDMATIADDPVRAMLGLSEYQSDAQAFSNALSSMNAVFTSEAVTFQSGERGYVFFYLTELAAHGTIASQTP